MGVHQWIHKCEMLEYPFISHNESMIWFWKYLHCRHSSFIRVNVLHDSVFILSIHWIYWNTVCTSFNVEKWYFHKINYLIMSINHKYTIECFRCIWVKHIRIELILYLVLNCIAKFGLYSNYYGHNLNMDHCEYDPNKTQAKSIKSTWLKIPNW